MLSRQVVLSRPSLSFASRPIFKFYSMERNISGQWVLVFSRSQNDLLVDHCDTCWWALFGWFSERTGGPGSAKHLQSPASWHYLIAKIKSSKLNRPHPGVLAASTALSRHWLGRVFCLSAHSKAISKISVVEIEYRFHR